MATAKLKSLTYKPLHSYTGINTSVSNTDLNRVYYCVLTYDSKDYEVYINHTFRYITINKNTSDDPISISINDTTYSINSDINIPDPSVFERQHILRYDTHYDASGNPKNFKNLYKIKPFGDYDPSLNILPPQ